MKTIALVGNPNSGKTTLFNSLTGSSAHVGNWPGVTVDKKTGIYKGKEEKVTIIDLPGIYSLSPYSPEEIISRDVILGDKVDGIINIVDATNLERNLYLTTQLMETSVPVIIALNMTDLLKKNGISIDIDKIEKAFGVKVVEISALKEENLDQLMKDTIEISSIKRKAKTLIKDELLIRYFEKYQQIFKEEEQSNPLFYAIKLVEKDELVVKDNKQIYEGLKTDLIKNKDDEKDFEAIIADYRYRFITDIQCITYENFEKENKSNKIDRVLTHKIFGLPIFLFVIFLVFHFTFSEDLFYLNTMGLLKDGGIVSFEGTAFEGLFANGGINSIGVVLANLVNSLTGLLSSEVGELISGASLWAQGLVVDGILGGLFAIIGFLPQILLLFLFFSILEDSGYMARIAFMLDKILRKFGLSGRALIPMLMGFGCSVPAMINTRTLNSVDEKVATIRVIPFFSCGAKLPILTAISGGIVAYFGVGNVDLITFSMYILGITLAFTAVLIMKNTIMKGKESPFIMELPNYHLPQFKSLMIHLYDKAKHFIEKAFTVILFSTILIWVMTHFSPEWKYLENSEMQYSILAMFGKIIAPIFTPLGFGVQLSSFGWIFVVAAISGLIAKENVIATLGTLGATIVGTIIDVEGDGGILATELMIKATNINIPGLLSFIAFNMTTIPCFAAVATAKAELPKDKYKSTLIFWLLSSYITSSAIYLIGTWWWTVFIFGGAIIIVVSILYIKNKRKVISYEFN